MINVKNHDITRSKNSISQVASEKGGGFHLKGGRMNERDIKPGYVYHIKDLFFETVKNAAW